LSLNYEELSRAIGEINASQKVVYVKNAQGREVPVLFRHPSHRDKEISFFVYNEAIRTAEEMGIPSNADMEDLAKTRKFFSEADSKKLEKLEKKIKGQQVLLSKTTRVPARRNRVKEVIEKLESEALTLKYFRDIHLENTRERKAAEEKLLFLTYKSTSDPLEDKPYWESYEDFKDEKDIVLRRDVFTNFVIFYHGLPASTIRFIARSNLWRIRYTTAIKTGAELFGTSISDYSTDQLMLVYWSNYYQSIYEMMSEDRPPESIIEDDASLDAYMKDYHAERSRDDAARAGKNNTYGKPSAWDKGEVLVFKSNDMHGDIEYSDTLAEKAAGKVGKSSVDAAAFGRSKDKK
jgi:hypothetical protein